MSNLKAMDAEMDKQSTSVTKEHIHKKLEQRLKKMVDKARVS
jgi:hypothetical protein